MHGFDKDKVVGLYVNKYYMEKLYQQFSAFIQYDGNKSIIITYL